MLDYKDVLQVLVTRFAVANIVTVTETNFGYIIWSKKGSTAETLRMRIVKFGGAFALFTILGMWLSPFNDTTLIAKLLITLVISSVLIAYAWFSRSNAGGIELHVDVSKREIRAASRTPKGECWINSTSRFGEVTGAMIVNGGGRTLPKALFCGFRERTICCQSRWGKIRFLWRSTTD